MLDAGLVRGEEALGFFLVEVTPAHLLAAIGFGLDGAASNERRLNGLRGHNGNVVEQGRVLCREEALPFVEALETGFDPLVVEAVEEFVGDDGEFFADGEVPQEGEETLLSEAQEPMGDLGTVSATEEEV